MSDTFQFLIVLSFAFLPVVIFAVIARGILRHLRNPEQLGRAMSMAIENELRKAGIDPGTDDFQTAISASGRSEKMATRFNRLAAQDLPPEVMKAIQKAVFRTLFGGAGTYTGDPRSEIPHGSIPPTPIDAPSRSDGRLALIVLLAGFGMVVALMLRETL